MKQLSQLMLVACALVSCLAMKAETLTVCNGIATDDRVPIYGYYQDVAGNETQMIYPSALIEEMEGGSIKSVTFYCASTVSSSLGSGTKVVTVGTTEATTLAGSREDGMTANRSTGTVVFTGALPTGGTEMTITFDEPFEYVGGNLFIDFYVQATGSYATTSWYGVEAAAGSSAVADRASSTTVTQRSFLPKATFDYEPGGDSEPYAAAVSATELAFGTCGVGSSNTLSITLKNKGTNAFSPVLSGMTAPFTTDYVTTELGSKESVTINVTYAPTGVGSHEGTLNIDCGEAGSFVISLSGNAEMSITLADGTATNSYAPLYGYYYDTQGTTTEVIYPATDLASLVGKRFTSMTFFANANIALSGGKLNFYVGEVDNTTMSSKDDINLEGLTLVSSAAIEPDGDKLVFTFDEPYTYGGGNLAIATYVAEKNTYKGTSFLGVNQDEVTGYCAYSSSSSVAVRFLPKVNIAYEEPQGLSASVKPQALNFATVVVGTGKTLEVTVSNTGLEEFNATVEAIDAPFSTTAQNATLAAGEKWVIPVTYSPVNATEASGTMTIDCGEAGSFTVTLNGKGVLVPTGYVETFDNITADNILPEGWTAYHTPLSWMSDVDLNASTTTQTTQYYVIYDQDGYKGLKDNTAFGGDFLVSPVLCGDIAIAAKLTAVQYVQANQVNAFAVIDNKIMAANGPEGAYAITWKPELSTEGFSYGFFHLDEPARIAIRISDAVLDLVAADVMIPETVEATLAQALGMNDGAAVLLTDDLLIADIEDDGLTILTDGQDNWMATMLTAEQIEALAQAGSMTGVQGILGGMDTNPFITITVDPQAGTRADKAEFAVIDMTEPIDRPGYSMATVTGYYSNGMLRANEDASFPGQCLAIDNIYIGNELETYVDRKVTLTVIVKLNQAWDEVADDADRASNYTIIPVGEIFAEDLPTGLTNITADGGQVTYINVAGMTSDRPFDGLNIVVERHADGTISTTKVVK